LEFLRANKVEERIKDKEFLRFFKSKEYAEFLK